MRCCESPMIYKEYQKSSNRTYYYCHYCGKRWFTTGWSDNLLKEKKMTTTWTDAQGDVHVIEKMETSYIQNCLAIIDERIPVLARRVNIAGQAQIELRVKQEQKAEMMRVLNARRRAEAAPVTNAHSCYTCSHSDTVLNQLICKKLNNFCCAVNFSCGAWSGK